MDYNEFVDVIFDVIENELPQGIVIKKNKVLKNNGSHRTGISFVEDSVNASPTFYLDGYYELFNQGTDISEIVEDILNAYYKNRLKDELNMDFFFDFNIAKEKLYLRIINYDMNAELLENVPHEKYMDLALVAYCKFEDERLGDASILIRNEHLRKWDVDSEEVISIAKDNTRYKMEYTIQNISSVLKDIAEDSQDLNFLSDNQPPMYIMTNVQKCFGAVFMIYNDIMNEFCRLFGGDCCVIPSSVHEVLVIPSADTSLDYMNSMVREVNRDHVAMEERLSDHAYLYRSVGGFSV